jgi:membrane protease YdiL (CAAX protease family)
MDVLMIAIFAFVAIVVTGGVALGVAHSLPRFHNVKVPELAESALVIIPAEVVAYLFLVAFMVQIVNMRSRGQAPFWDSSGRANPMPLDFSQPGRQGNFLDLIHWNMPGPGVALAALVGGAALALASGFFTTIFQKWVPKNLPIDELFRDRNSAYLLALFGILVAPLVEELFFRGFLYPALAKHLGMVVSVLLTAGAFAVIHQGQLAHAWVPLSWLFVVGIVLTVVRAKTKSVATSVLIHIGYNATLFTIVFIATQGFRHMERA